jgi:uncharacterized protein with HEPN domain
MRSNLASALTDMLHAARKAREMTAGMTLAAFLQDEKTCWAIYSQIIILGEAANRIAREQQMANADLPWRLVIGMRNRLVHGYDDIVWERVWATLENDLPPLIEQLEKILTSPSSS